MKTPIITSFLDDDLYKYTMAQVVWKKHPDTHVRYRYKCRTPGIDLDRLAPKIQWQIDAMADLRLTDSENDYLGTIRYLQPGFRTFLKRFYLDPKDVKIKTGPFDLEIEGNWGDSIFWEIFLLAIISQTHYEDLVERGEIDQEAALRGADERLTEKIRLIKEATSQSDLIFRLIEFGTRRRYSEAQQRHVLTRLVQEIPDQIFGTSNLRLAMELGIKASGTMAHEYLQAFQALTRVRDSQKAALQTWADVYRGDLGIALTDVICMDAFLKDFDLYFAKLYDGMRHDSGDPYVWANKAINHYKSLQIDPRTKAAVFSNGLNVPKALELWRTFEPQIKTSYGIGTALSCDLPGVTPLNHVLKMTYCNGSPVAKLTDEPGKGMCEDDSYEEYLKKAYNYHL